MSRRSRTGTALVLLVVGLAACGDDGGSGEEAVGTSSSSSVPAPDETAAGDADDGSGQVDIVDFRFEPAAVTVAAGTTVRWENKDEAAHSVADRALDVESEELAQRGTFERTFDEPGEFPYVCGIHNYMEGIVTVE